MHYTQCTWCRVYLRKQLRYLAFTYVVITLFAWVTLFYCIMSLYYLDQGLIATISGLVTNNTDTAIMLICCWLFCFENWKEHCISFVGEIFFFLGTGSKTRSGTELTVGRRQGRKTLKARHISHDYGYHSFEVKKLTLHNYFNSHSCKLMLPYRGILQGVSGRCALQPTRYIRMKSELNM